MVEVLSDTFLTAELRDAVFSAQAIEHNSVWMRVFGRPWLSWQRTPQQSETALIV